MKNNLPNVWLDEIDIEECRGTEYHWCSHNQKDTFNICYTPKERYDIAVRALKRIAGRGLVQETYLQVAEKALKELGE